MKKHKDYCSTGRVNGTVEWGIKIVFYTLFATGVAILACIGITLLWNWLIPDLFGLRSIHFLEAAGLLLMVRLLFGGMGCGSRCGSRCCSGKACCKGKNRKCGSKGNYSKWKFYDEYWEEEGQKAFDDYVERLKNDQKEISDR